MKWPKFYQDGNGNFRADWDKIPAADQIQLNKIINTNAMNPTKVMSALCNHYTTRMDSINPNYKEDLIKEKKDKIETELKPAIYQTLAAMNAEKEKLEGAEKILSNPLLHLIKLSNNPTQQFTEREKLLTNSISALPFESVFDAIDMVEAKPMLLLGIYSGVKGRPANADEKEIKIKVLDKIIGKVQMDHSGLHKNRIAQLEAVKAVLRFSNMFSSSDRSVADRLTLGREQERLTKLLEG